MWYISRTLRGVRAAAALVMLGALGGTALARDFEIKSLKADAYGGRGAWNIELRYDVRADEHAPRVPLELVVYATDDGRPVVDAAGNPLQYVFALGEPSKVDDDGAAKWVGRVTTDTFAGWTGDPKHIRIHADLVFAGQRAPLHYKTIKLKVHR
jgi:hypothetical protein